MWRSRRRVAQQRGGVAQQVAQHVAQHPGHVAQQKGTWRSNET